MKRRTVRAGAGTALVAVAGCVTDAGTGEPSPSENDTEGGATSDAQAEETPVDGTPDGDLVYGNYSEGDSAEAAFGDIDWPSFAESVDTTVCSHTGSDTGVAVSVSQEVLSPTTDDDSVQTVAIALHNVSDSKFGFNPHAWQLKRRTGDGWRHVAPQEYVEPWYTLEPDERYVWTVGVESRSAEGGENSLAVTADLASATYAFQMTGQLGDLSVGDDESTTAECVAIFEVNRAQTS